jgi:hypothetical protein
MLSSVTVSVCEFGVELPPETSLLERSSQFMCYCFQLQAFLIWKYPCCVEFVKTACLLTSSSVYTIEIVLYNITSKVWKRIMTYKGSEGNYGGMVRKKKENSVTVI